MIIFRLNSAWHAHMCLILIDLQMFIFLLFFFLFSSHPVRISSTIWNSLLSSIEHVMNFSFHGLTHATIRFTRHWQLHFFILRRRFIDFGWNTYINNSAQILIASLTSTAPYSSDLEELQNILHFPEEVALRLTDAEYLLYYQVCQPQKTLSPEDF